jgi:hypothetical protein
MRVYKRRVFNQNTRRKGKQPCERCDVLRYNLYITPWGELCRHCSFFARLAQSVEAPDLKSV